VELPQASSQPCRQKAILQKDLHRLTPQLIFEGRFLSSSSCLSVHRTPAFPPQAFGQRLSFSRGLRFPAHVGSGLRHFVVGLPDTGLIRLRFADFVDGIICAAS
jgi:hypothetical protein